MRKLTTGQSYKMYRYEWIIPDEEKMNINDVFVLCKASELGLYDEFMNYNPSTIRERKLKDLLEESIKSGLKDFFRPICDPSFDRDYSMAVEDYLKKIKERKICYVKGEKPARGQSYNWWKENARCLCPDRGSRLGTKKEYIAFLGTLIKKLVEIGWKINEAWDAVCNFCRVEEGYSKHGKKLKYIRTENAKYIVDPTVSREVSVFFDLTRTAKIFAWDEVEQGFWISGVYCNVYMMSDVNFHKCVWECYNLDKNEHFWSWYAFRLGNFKFMYHSLIDFGLYADYYCDSWEFYNSVGWIVLEK